jgi:hypothetical protein
VFVGAAILVGADGARSWAFARDAVVGLLSLLVFGQLLPRAVGRRWAPQLVPVLVPVLRIVDLVVTPFLRVAQAVTRLLVRPPAPHEADVREGLEDLLRDGAFEGMGSTEEMAIISGVMQFGEKTVIDVMTPRADIFALDTSLTAREVADRLAQSGLPRAVLPGFARQHRRHDSRIRRIQRWPEAHAGTAPRDENHAHENGPTSCSSSCCGRAVRLPSCTTNSPRWSGS